MFNLPPELSGLVLPQYRQAMIPKEPVELPWSDDKSWETWLKDPVWKRRAFTADKDHMNSVLMSKPLGDLLSVAYLKSIRTHVHRNGLSYLSSFTGPHRCQAAGDKVLLADGTWKNIEEVKVGDVLLSPQNDGTVISSKVLETSSHFEEDVYDVVEPKLTNKRLYTCSKNHPIPILGTFHPRLDKEGVRLPKRLKIRTYKELTAEHISSIEKSAMSSRIVTFTSPTVEFNQPDSAMDPYCLGLWLGDGHCSTTIRGSVISHGLGITTNDDEIIRAIGQRYPHEIIRIANKDDTSAVTVCLTTKPSGRFLSELKRLGLVGTKSGSKFIPHECLVSSVAYRLRLLAGLIDTDGRVPKNICSIEIITKSDQLAKDIQDLVHSLGGNGRITKTKGEIKSIGFIAIYNCVRFSFKADKIKMLADEVRVERKKKRLFEQIARYEQTNRNHKNYDPRYVSIKCVRTKPQMVYGFTLDSPSHLYITNDWLVTHNTAKSVSASLFAHILDSTMWDSFESRIIQSPYQFMTCMKGIIDDEIIGASVVVDEAGTTFSSGDWYEKWMKVIQKFLQTCGMLKPKLFFVAPNREFIVSGMRKLIIAEHHMKKFKPEFSRMSCYHVKYNFMKKGDPYFFRRPVIRIAGQNITLKHINIFEPPKWFVDRYRNLTEPDKKDRMSKWTKEAQKLISGQEEEEEDIDYDTLIEEVWKNKGTFFGRVNREGLPVIEQNTLEIELGIKPKQAKYIKERIDKRLRQAKAEADEMNREKQEKAEQDAREASEQRMAGLKKKLVDELAPKGTEERKEQKENMNDALEELLSATDD